METFFKSIGMCDSINCVATLSNNFFFSCTNYNNITILKTIKPNVFIEANSMSTNLPGVTLEILSDDTMKFDLSIYC